MEKKELSSFSIYRGLVTRDRNILATLPQKRQGSVFVLLSSLHYTARGSVYEGVSSTITGGQVL